MSPRLNRPASREPLPAREPLDYLLDLDRYGPPQRKPRRWAERILVACLLFLGTAACWLSLLHPLKGLLP